MYVMNCVEVEITSPEEAFEVLFKGKTLNLLFHQKLSWKFYFDTQSKHQSINIFSLFDKKKNKLMIYTLYTCTKFYFTYLKKNSLKYVWKYIYAYIFFLHNKVNLWFYGDLL